MAFDTVNWVPGMVTLTGLGPVLKRLRQLSDIDQKKQLSKAVRAGGTVVRKAAIQKAREFDDPKTTEKIFKNIVVQAAPRYGKRVNGVVMRVGVRGGAKQYGNTKENVRKGRVGKKYKTGGDTTNPGGDTWYWRFKEFGAPSLGIAPTNFMLRSLEENAQAATDVITRSLDRSITSMMLGGSL